MDGTTCSVCLDLFSSQPPHRPKMLLCGHSTCEECIHQWTNRNNPPLVQCPHCRRQFKGLSLDDVPINFALLDVLTNVNGESRKRKGQGEKKPSNKKLNNNHHNNNINDDDDDDVVILSKQCEITNGNCNQTATHRCMECPEGNQLMCKDHLFQHSSFKAVFASHNPIRIEDLPPSLTSSSSSSSVRRTCSDHIGQALTVYCWDCSKAVCDRCALFGHKTHSYSEIHQAADRMKKELEEEKNEVEERMRAMKQMADDLETAKSSLEAKSTELLRMTDRMFDEIREALEMMRTAMKKRVIDQKRKSDGDVNKLQEELTAAIARGEEKVKKMETVLLESDDAVVGEGGGLLRKKKDGGRGGRGEEGIMEECRATMQRLEKEFNCAAEIDLERMNETKMMMEEGMKAALASYWGGFEDNEDNNNNNTNEKKRKKFELVVSRWFSGGAATSPHLQIVRHVNTVTDVYGVVWNRDGKSLYVAGEGTLRLINAADGVEIKEIPLGDNLTVRNLAVSKKGDVYVTDCQAHKVYVISGSTGKIIREIGSTQGAHNGQFNDPFSVYVVDEWNEFFVCDGDNHRIQVFSTVDGRFIRKFSSGENFDPTSISIDVSRGFIFVCEFGNDRVQVFNRQGRIVNIFESHGKGDGQLKNPHGILANPATKEFIVCDRDNDRLCVFDYDGDFKFSVTTVGMESPVFMSLKKDGRLAISCDGHHGVFFAQLRRQ